MPRAKPAAPTTNSVAMAATVAALRGAGRVEDVDAAVVQMALGLAESVDADPGNAALWREYRAVEERLRGLGDGGSDDEFVRLLAELHAPVGDAKD
jgi:hypothetical protein